MHWALVPVHTSLLVQGDYGLSWIQPDIGRCLPLEHVIFTVIIENILSQQVLDIVFKPEKRFTNSSDNMLIITDFSSRRKAIHGKDTYTSV